MDLQSFLLAVSVGAIPLVFAITVHEVAHGWVARRYGDRTAEAAGRLTLNPIKHIDPIGTLLLPAMQLLFLGRVLFGWARPVPVNERFLRNPRRDMVKVAIAGPAANIVMALLWAALYAAVLKLGPAGDPSDWALQMALTGVMFNIVLAAFNLLPVLPLDGGRVLVNSLPQGRITRLLESMEPWGLLIVVTLLVTGLAQAFVVPLAEMLSAAVFSVVGAVFSVSGM
jgi:Zn-dependent protease